jgi:hypothetical protein
MKNKLLIPLIVVSLLLVLAVTWYFLQPRYQFKTYFPEDKTGLINTSPVNGEAEANKDLKTYTDSAKIFSFAYPQKFVLSGAEIGYSQNWSNNNSGLGLILATVTIPKSFLPNTNFGDAKFVVGTSADSKAVRNCLLPVNGETVFGQSEIINGQSFTKLSSKDAGAGNFYETLSYRTLYNNNCYSVQYTIHSTNIQNYSPDQGISEFDKTQVQNILEALVRSFKFSSSQ